MPRMPRSSRTPNNGTSQWNHDEATCAALPGSDDVVDLKLIGGAVTKSIRNVAALRLHSPLVDISATTSGFPAG